jgi:hypothetical protein
MLKAFSKKIITKKNLVIIFVVLMILLFGLCIYRYFVNPTKQEGFAVSINDLDGSNAKATAPVLVNAGLSDTIQQISQMLNVSGTTPQTQEFDPKLPGVCLDEMSICSGIRDPLKLPKKKTSDISGCGWYFAEDADKPSFPAYGTKDGPYLIVSRTLLGSILRGTPRGNAVKDFGSRIRQNSGVWRESPKSGDFGYDVRAGSCPRQNP